MAGKKKKTETEEVEIEDDDKNTKLIALLNKEYGQGVIKSVDQFLANESEKKTISISPAHDLALGGVPQGSTILFLGKPKSGKTTTAIHLAKKCQAAGMGAWYLNIEGRLKKRDITQVDISDFHIIESTEETFMTGIMYLNLLVKLMQSTTEQVFIIDSLSMLADDKEIENGIGSSSRGGGARNLSQFFKYVAGLASPRRHIIIGMVQYIANTSGYGSHFSESGGQKQNYQADIKIRVKNFEFWLEGEDTIGQTVNWNVDWSALNGFPNQEYQSYIRYGQGIDENRELLAFGETLGVIDKAGGGWYTIGDKKLQGDAKALAYLAENPDVVESIKAKLSEYNS